MLSYKQNMLNNLPIADFKCVKWVNAQKQLRQQAKVPLVAVLKPGIPQLTCPRVISTKDRNIMTLSKISSF